MPLNSVAQAALEALALNRDGSGYVIPDDRHAKPRGRDWRLQGGVDGGVAVGWGTDFARNSTSASPVATAWAGVSVPFAEWVRVEGGLRVNIARVELAAVSPSPSEADPGVPEPLLRAELTAVPVFRVKNTGAR